MSPQPKYRLQALLSVRRRLRRKAEENLAKAIKKLAEEKKKLEELKEEKKKLEAELKQAKRELSNKMLIGAVAGEGHRHVNFVRRVEEDIEKKEEEITEQEAKLEEAKQAVALARREYIDACKALRVMEKHKELWEKKRQHELSKKEEKELDDLGQTIHQLRRWKGEKSLFEV